MLVLLILVNFSSNKSNEECIAKFKVIFVSQFNTFNFYSKSGLSFLPTITNILKVGREKLLANL